MDRVVVVGGGQAGGQAVDSLRREGFEGEVILVTAEDHAPYQRPPLSKDYLAGRYGLDRVLLRPETFYAENSIELMTRTRVSSIDLGARRVEFAGGDTLGYDRLLLATGSRVRRLDALPGADLEGVMYLRTVEDSDRIRAAMEGAESVAVVGGGYIGLEVASVAVASGRSAVVLEALPRLLSRVATVELAEFYAELHRSRGVDLRLGAAVAEFRGEGGAVRSVGLADGGDVPADLVVVGIGIEPVDDLARAAGIDCDNGITVDARCATSAPGVFAAGDCTCHPNAFFGRRVRLESVPNAMEQGRVAAAAMLGRDRTYDSEPWFWSDQHGVRLQMAGLSEGADRSVTRGTPGESFITFHLRDGVVIGADAVDSVREFIFCRRLVAARARPDPAQLADGSIPVKTLL